MGKMTPLLSRRKRWKKYYVRLDIDLSDDALVVLGMKYSPILQTLVVGGVKKHQGRIESLLLHLAGEKAVSAKMDSWSYNRIRFTLTGFTKNEWSEALEELQDTVGVLLVETKGFRKPRRLL